MKKTLFACLAVASLDNSVSAMQPEFMNNLQSMIQSQVDAQVAEVVKKKDAEVASLKDQHAAELAKKDKENEQALLELSAKIDEVKQHAVSLIDFLRGIGVKVYSEEEYQDLNARLSALNDAGLRRHDEFERIMSEIKKEKNTIEEELKKTKEGKSTVEEELQSVRDSLSKAQEQIAKYSETISSLESQLKEANSRSETVDHSQVCQSTEEGFRFVPRRCSDAIVRMFNEDLPAIYKRTEDLAVRKVLGKEFCDRIVFILENCSSLQHIENGAKLPVETWYLEAFSRISREIMETTSVEHFREVLRRVRSVVSDAFFPPNGWEKISIHFDS